MTVPVNKRTHGKLEVCTKAHDLCVYTLQITKNKKIFVPEYQDVLTNKIVQLSIEIHTEVWSANNVLVQSSETLKYRRHFQDSAAIKCNLLLSLIDLAWSVFHLTGKRVAFWAGKVIETRNLIRAWSSSDAKRYKQYRGES